MRPWLSVVGTRWKRWTPFSYLNRLNTSVPKIAAMIS